MAYGLKVCSCHPKCLVLEHHETGVLQAGGRGGPMIKKKRRRKGKQRGKIKNLVNL